MARLFTAVELTAEARAAAAERQTGLLRALRAAGDADLRPVKPEHLHLTIVFIGEVDEPRMPAVVQSLSAPVALHPFRLTLGKAGAFPPRGPLRVLWLGVERGAGALAAVYDELAARLQQLGVVLETRPYRPHLTLGRWRIPGAPALRRVLDEERPTPVVEQTVETVTLFRSYLRPDGPEHVPLARIPLA